MYYLVIDSMRLWNQQQTTNPIIYLFVILHHGGVGRKAKAEVFGGSGSVSQRRNCVHSVVYTQSSKWNWRKKKGDGKQRTM